jgi:hypothetical protein
MKVMTESGFPDDTLLVSSRRLFEKASVTLIEFIYSYAELYYQKFPKLLFAFII